MQLHCKACGKPIPAEDVNIKRAIAKCEACNAVFGFADDLAGEAALARPTVPLPPRFTLDAWGPELTITRRWYSHSAWLLLFFCIFWDGFLVIWYTVGASMILSGQGGAGGWIMVLFPVIHLAVGIGLTYATVCLFLNKTVVRVVSGQLSVWHGPIPTWGNREVATSDIQQLFCTESRHSHKRGCHYSYNLAVLKRDNTKLKLIENLEELDQALFLEQQVEKHLQLADQRVPGEARG